jgi:hypothetical protein
MQRIEARTNTRLAATRAPRAFAEPCLAVEPQSVWHSETHEDDACDNCEDRKQPAMQGFSKDERADERRQQDPSAPLDRCHINRRDARHGLLDSGVRFRVGGWGKPDFAEPLGRRKRT